jgi:hypothetical protein
MWHSPGDSITLTNDQGDLIPIHSTLKKASNIGDAIAQCGGTRAENKMLYKAGSGSNHVVIWSYITGTDRRTVRAQTVLRLDASFNTRYGVKYYVFA